MNQLRSRTHVAVLFLFVLLISAAAQQPIRKSPDNSPSVSYSRAQQLIERHQLSEARMMLQKLLGARPSADGYLMLADVAREQSDFAVTMSSLQRAAKLDPQREDAYLEFSQICADHGNAQLALDSADIGLANIPGSYRLKIQKGVSLDQLGRFEDAATVLKEASAQQADKSLALLSLGIVLTHANELDEADQVFSEAAEQYPRNARIHYFRAKLLLQLASSRPGADGIRDKALQEFTAATRYDSTHADSWYQLAVLYPDDKREDAETALNRCLKLDPQHASAQYALARLYIRTGRKAEGEAMLARYKVQQRAAEMQQNKQLRIDVAQR